MALFFLLLAMVAPVMVLSTSINCCRNYPSLVKYLESFPSATPFCRQVVGDSVPTITITTTHTPVTHTTVVATITVTTATATSEVTRTKTDVSTSTESKVYFYTQTDVVTDQVTDTVTDYFSTSSIEILTVVSLDVDTTATVIETQTDFQTQFFTSEETDSLTATATTVVTLEVTTTVVDVVSTSTFVTTETLFDTTTSTAVTTETLQAGKRAVQADSVEKREPAPVPAPAIITTNPSLEEILSIACSCLHPASSTKTITTAVTLPQKTATETHTKYVSVISRTTVTVTDVVEDVVTVPIISGTTIDITTDVTSLTTAELVDTITFTSPVTSLIPSTFYVTDEATITVTQDVTSTIMTSITAATDVISDFVTDTDFTTVPSTSIVTDTASTTVLVTDVVASTLTTFTVAPTPTFSLRASGGTPGGTYLTNPIGVQGNGFTYGVLLFGDGSPSTFSVNSDGYLVGISGYFACISDPGNGFGNILFGSLAGISQLDCPILTCSINNEDEVYGATLSCTADGYSYWLYDSTFYSSANDIYVYLGDAASVTENTFPPTNYDGTTLEVVYVGTN